jgi:hypothetical protein
LGLAFNRTWRIPAAIGIGTLIAFLSVLFLLRSSVPATTTYLARFEFKFPGVESGKFPNGDTFSLNEIIEPAIISPVYERFKLDQYGIDRDEFFNAFSIRPYVPEEGEITERFRQQLADRRLTLTERERLEARLRSLLDEASRGGAEIAMTLRRNFGIPNELGRSIVQMLPQAWSQYEIEKKGVLRLPAFTGSDVGISPSVLESVSLPMALVMLSQASDRLRGRLSDARLVAGIETAIEPSSRKSLRDLENDFHDLEVFKVNPLRAAIPGYAFPEGIEEIRLLAQQRIRELETDRILYSGTATALANTASQFVQSIVVLKGGSEGRRANSEQGGAQLGGTTTIPQLSENFIDKMIELSARGRASDENQQRYISDLSARQLGTVEKLVRVQTEQEKWQHFLAELDGKTKPVALDETNRARLTRNLLSAAAELNSSWQVLNKLESEFASNRLSHTAQLYNLFLTLPDVVKYDPFFNGAVLSLGLAAAWFVFLSIWAIRSFLHFNRSRTA